MQLSKILKPKMSRSAAAVLKPATPNGAWLEGHDDAKARRHPANIYPAGSKLAAAYERGFLAGVAARGFDSG